MDRVTSYDYAATLTKVDDGDTIWLAVAATFDMGFKVTLTGACTQKFRLARCNAPELPTPAGETAKQFTATWLATHATNLRVTSKGQDKYGRWLGEVYDAVTAENLSDALLASGNAVPYR